MLPNCHGTIGLVDQLGSPNPVRNLSLQSPSVNSASTLE